MNRSRSGRRPTVSRPTPRAALGATVLIAALAAGARGTQDAVANGDTRSLSLIHMHTGEGATITYRRDGRYDSQALDQLNWLLRDWRIGQPTKMDPRLFDVVWQVYREVGSREPIYVASAYRSPGTNSMLRRRSRAVSDVSQHMAGKAMDLHFPDVSVDRVRAVAMRAQHGGVGYYPNAGNPFVHLDTGSVRAWPRMTRDQLARLFPTGKTVHIPKDGQPLAGYEEAKAEILARGGTVAGYSAYASADEGGGRRRSLWATLFGGDDEDAEYYRGSGVAAYAPSNSEDGGVRGFLALFRPAQPRQAEAPQQVAQPEPREDAPKAAEAQNPPAPLPPRRPSDLAQFAEAPLPPTRPIAVAGIGMVPMPSSRSDAEAPAAARPAGLPEPASPPQGGAKPNADDKAALSALFATVATKPAPTPRAKVATSRAKSQPVAPGDLLADIGPALNMRFASKPADDLNASRFMGPVVKPLPVLR